MALGGVSLERGGDGRIVALGGARGEDDIQRMRPDQPGYLLARGFDHALKLRAEFVSARWITLLGGEVGHHCVQNFGRDGRGGVVVQVDHNSSYRRHTRRATISRETVFASGDDVVCQAACF